MENYIDSLVAWQRGARDLINTRQVQLSLAAALDKFLDWILDKLHVLSTSEVEDTSEEKTVKLEVDSKELNEIVATVISAIVHISSEFKS